MTIFLKHPHKHTYTLTHTHADSHTYTRRQSHIHTQTISQTWTQTSTHVFGNRMYTEKLKQLYSFTNNTHIIRNKLHNSNSHTLTQKFVLKTHLFISTKHSINYISQHLQTSSFLSDSQTNAFNTLQILTKTPLPPLFFFE